MCTVWKRVKDTNLASTQTEDKGRGLKKTVLRKIKDADWFTGMLRAVNSVQNIVI